MVDGLIAATVLEHDLTVVTRNVKDFARLGAMVFNPWDACECSLASVDAGGSAR